jgi:energy-converting hydrogenase Eha subunit F
MRLRNLGTTRSISIMLIALASIFSISCAPSLYPNQYYRKGLRVKKASKSKYKKQIQQYDNCGMNKKN